MKKYVTSAFSLQMVPEGAHLDIKRISPEEAHSFYTIQVPEPDGSDSGYIPPESMFAVFRLGHEGTAKYFGKPVDRTPVNLQQGDTCLVAQPVGSRLQPGQEIQTPDLAFFLVRVLPPWGPILTHLHQMILDADEAYEEEESPERRTFIRNSIQPVKWLLE